MVKNVLIMFMLKLIQKMALPQLSQQDVKKEWQKSDGNYLHANGTHLHARRAVCAWRLIATFDTAEAALQTYKYRKLPRAAPVSQIANVCFIADMGRQALRVRRRRPMITRAVRLPISQETRPVSE